MSSGYKLPSSHEIISSVCREALTAFEELRANPSELEKKLPGLLCEQLKRTGFYAMVGTRQIMADFGAAIDIVAWKASYGVALAIVVAADIAGDRTIDLEEFNPKLLIPSANLLKLFIDINAPREISAPTTAGGFYSYGLSSSAQAQVPVAADQDSDALF